MKTDTQLTSSMLGFFRATLQADHNRLCEDIVCNIWNSPYWKELREQNERTKAWQKSNYDLLMSVLRSNYTPEP